MITFKQFLLEEKLDLIKFLRDNCAEALAAFSEAGRGRFFWRGVKTKPKEHVFTHGENLFSGFIGHPREDRRPRDTPPWAHAVINEFFKEKFNEPLRSNALFTFASRRSAIGYGWSPMAIIPIGHFKIYWSPKVTDLTIALFPDIEGDATKQADVAGGAAFWEFDEKIKPEEVTIDMQKKYIRDFLESADYREGPTDQALRSDSELMVRCKSYLALAASAAELADAVEAATDKKND